MKMTDKIRKRLKWVKLYEHYGHAGTVCLKYGISRPTLRKWPRRYEASGIEGLRDESRKPKHIYTKVTSEQEALVLKFRCERNLGHRRIQNELIRQHELLLSLSTIHGILHKHGVPHLDAPRWRKPSFKRYTRRMHPDGYLLDHCQAPSIHRY